MTALSGFHGPLFVIGLSRSGTTLIRDLLNRHDQVNLPKAESHFIPMLVKQFGETPDLNDPVIRRRMVRMIAASTYASIMANRGQPIDPDAILARMPRTDLCDFLGFLFRRCAEEPGRTDTIWGDKTPNYLMHVPMLKRICPEARFLHIVRDVRDRCISVRGMWRKNLYRAADQWEEHILYSRGFADRFGRDYTEIHYEELLRDPPAVLRGVCDFLEIPFQDKMTQLQRPVQRFGDARNRSEIVRDNTGKYRSRISKAELLRIEQVAWPMMIEMGYEPVLANAHKPLRSLARLAFVFRDRIAHIRFNIRRRGFFAGLRRAILIYMTDIVHGKQQPGDDG